MRTLVVTLLAVAAPVAAEQHSAGTYWQEDTCAPIDLGRATVLQWCVDKVVILPQGGMELEVSWAVTGLSGGSLEKGSDRGNGQMYLTDELGNRYDHSDTRGAAAEGGRILGDGSALRGVYVFPAPEPGAMELTFHDEEQGLAIRGIMLSERVRNDRATTVAVLGRVMQTEAIEIEYAWEGKGVTSHETYQLDEVADGFRATGLRDGQRKILLAQEHVPSADVESFLAALAQAPLLDKPYEPKVTRADDHPSISITLRRRDQAIEFLTRSHGKGHVPWALEAGGHVYVVPDDTPARALQMLDPFFGRDLESRAVRFLAPVVGDERAQETWTILEGELGEESAYKIAFQLKDLLNGERDDEVWAELERFLEARKAPPAPKAPIPSEMLPDGDTAFVRAARDGDRERLETFLANGVDPDERSERDGYTALIAAAANGHAPAVRALITAGADASARSRSGETALTLAASKNRVAAVEALLEGDIDANIKGRDGKTPLMQAAENGRAQIVVLLVDAGADVNARSLRGDTALALGAESNHIAVVRLLLGASADPNVADSANVTPLMKTEHPGVARALIRARANVNATDDQGISAIMRLASDDQGGNRFGDQARVEVGDERVEALRMLLTASADIDAQDRRGRTALIWATSGTSSQPAVVQLLVEEGADVDVVDASGGTALLHAAIHGHTESARILIDGGADVNVRMGGSTALGFALQHQHTELVTLLLRAGGRR